jgi:DinB superfamily
LDQLQDAAKKLETTGAAIANLLGDMTVGQARWRPAPESWSALEVLNHLYDEEREDFRQRLDITLHSPGQEFAPIDPKGWVTTRSYNTRELRESLERFCKEREYSISWLLSVQDPDLGQMCSHKSLQGLRAGDLLVSWVAHDLLHLRQLIELRWQYLGTTSSPFRFDYAGEW